MIKLRLFSLFLLFFTCVLQTNAQIYVTDSFLIDNHQRSFHFTKPDRKQKKSSLIFILHGSGGNGLNMREAAFSIEQLSVKENCILVYPNGYKKFWNECRKASTAQANLENIDEQRFFNAMITYFKTNYTIDEKKIFAIGFSGGGQMAFKLALTMPGKFKAIATIVANLPTPENMDCIENPGPISVLMVNGTADGVCPFYGGEMKAQNITLGNVKSTMETFYSWAQINQYYRKPKFIKISDKDLTDSISIEKFSYSGKKTSVVLYKVNNGKHEFPKELDVFTTAVAFFKKQKRIQ